MCARPRKVSTGSLWRGGREIIILFTFKGNRLILSIFEKEICEKWHFPKKDVSVQPQLLLRKVKLSKFCTHVNSLRSLLAQAFSGGGGV